MNVQIKFVKTHPDAVLPRTNHGNRTITDDEKNKIIEAQEDYYRALAIKSGQSINDVKLNVRAQQHYYDEQTGEVFGTSDTGYDLFACQQTTIHAKGSAVVPTGISVGFITPGVWFRIEARSGLGFKHGIQPHFGVVDNSYRGDLGVKLYNLSDKDYIVNQGDRIAQMVLYPVIQANLEWIDQAEDTHRGDKGFGSSGQ